jgi:hypothetical protein
VSSLSDGGARVRYVVRYLDAAEPKTARVEAADAASAVATVSFAVDGAADGGPARFELLSVVPVVHPVRPVRGGE